MNNKHSGEIGSMLIGSITSVSIGTFFLHALSAFLLALIGAAGGWCFQHYIKPRLDKLKAKYDIRKLTKKKPRKKAQ